MHVDRKDGRKTKLQATQATVDKLKASASGCFGALSMISLKLTIWNAHPCLSYQQLKVSIDYLEKRQDHPWSMEWT